MAGRRQLTVSVVPKYGDAIMDGDSDGFPGLIASEIAADDEAAALVEQFVATVSYRPCLLLSLLARPGPGIRARARGWGGVVAMPSSRGCAPQTGMQLDVPQSSIQVNGITAGRRRLMVEDGVLQEKMQLRIDYQTL